MNKNILKILLLILVVLTNCMRIKSGDLKDESVDFGPADSGIKDCHFEQDGFSPDAPAEAIEFTSGDATSSDLLLKILAVRQTRELQPDHGFNIELGTGLKIGADTDSKSHKQKRKFDNFKRFVCSVEGCGRSYSRSNNLADHIASAHTHEKQHKCVHSGCDMAFFKKSSLARHEKSHSDDKKFKCSDCGRTFCRSDQFIDHITRTHTDNRPHKCDHPDCGAAFASKSDLAKHKRRHIDYKPFLCPSCDRTFFESSNLAAHVARAHVGEKPHKCDHPNCSAAFVAKSDLKRHKKIHVDVKVDQLLTLEIGMDPKPRKRQRTGRVVKAPGFMVLNTPVEQPECMVCGYSCSTVEEVSAHVKVAHPVSMELS